MKFADWQAVLLYAANFAADTVLFVFVVFVIKKVFL